jgi:hypothetical protein
LRFLKNFDRDIRPALKDEHPEMTEVDVEVFKRKWICESGGGVGDNAMSELGNES